MGRILVFILFVGVIVAFVAILGSFLGSTKAEAQRRLQTVFGPTKDGVMAPTQMQKIAYVALIVLLFGTASGWLGGI